MTMAERIRARRTELGITQQQIADEFGISREAVSLWEKADGTQPKGKRLNQLASFLQTTVDYLIAGVQPVGNRLDDGNSAARRQLNMPFGDIAEIDVTAGAGLGGEAVLENFSENGRDVVAADVVRARWQLPPGYLSQELRVQREFARIIVIEGDSMAPTLHSGDRVMVDISRRTPSPPGIFALWDGLGLIVKRLEYIPQSEPATVRIISDNPAHQPYERTVEEAHIIGRVIWFGRRL